MQEVEIAVLRGFLTSSETTGWQEHFSDGVVALLQSLLKGDFEAVLLNPQMLELMSGGDDSCGDTKDVEAYLERRVLAFLSKEDKANSQLTVMVLAVACLHLFSQSNWTGPPVSVHVPDLLPPAFLSSFPQPQDLTNAVHNSLLLDGESVYSLVANPFLLLLARVLLYKCSSKMDCLQLLPWWTLRYVKLHQQVLEACSQQLLVLAQSSMEKVTKCEILFSDRRHRNLAIQFHLECVYTHLTYYDYEHARDHLQKAQELSGLEIGMTGALGKRTRFQQNFLAQLLLVVKRKEDLPAPVVSDELTLTPTPVANLPKDNDLQDDTVLNQINLAEPDRYQLPDLSAEEQALILGVCTDTHSLTEEDLLAFTNSILSQPKFWAIMVTALCIRTKLEKGSSRRVERAMRQTQTIVDHFEDKSCPVTERLKVFYCCQAPPRWDIQKQLASLLTEQGCTSSALLIYEKLELWEDVVICYERIGQHGKAEEILRRELEKKETPSLYCLLGDVKREHQYYDRAWELSGGRSARAMRSKALLHLRNKEFQQCVDCFEQAVRINTLQLGVWFSLGCAYFALERCEGAARAFQWCVRLEPDNAEGWSNLSAAYIRLQKKDKAFHTLQEALKCNFEHWQIWENFIGVCIDIGEFREATAAYHRLMDLREKYKDIQILEILVRAVVENLTDNRGEHMASLRPKLRELMARVTSRHSPDAQTWQLYAQLYGNGHSTDPEDNEKALQFLSKAHRCQVQVSGWENDTATFKDVVKRAIHMGQVAIECSKDMADPKVALQTLSSTRLSLRCLATKAKQTYTEVTTGQLSDDLGDDVAKLEQLIAELQGLSGALRSHSGWHAHSPLISMQKTQFNKLEVKLLN